MMRMSEVGCTAWMVMLTAMALVCAVGAWADGTVRIHTQGRVAVNLPENGALGVCRYEGARRGIVWPRTDGLEFLGSGGMFVRFRSPDESTYDLVAPGDFEAAGAEMRTGRLYEGCEGGRRYPHADGDDDGDGVEDEDPLDGLDNDGDGAIDEDFAAVGDGMVVTRAVEPRGGFVLRQRSYTWNYGHVRDFIGFTTEVTYDADPRDGSDGIRDVTLAAYIDFNIGKQTDEERGADDRFFFLGAGAREGGGELPTATGITAVADGAGGGPFAAVLVFEATGPHGVRVETEGFIMEVTGRPDSLWTRLKRAGRGVRCAVCGDSHEGGAQEIGEVDPSAEFTVFGAVDGDRGIVHRIGPVTRLVPGDRVAVEWAIVFGGSRGALVKNVRRAVETFRGVRGDDGRLCRWIVPPRRAARREFDVTLASVWTGGERNAAAAVAVPNDLVSEEVEWIRVNDRCTSLYERVGSKIVLPLGETRLAAGAEPFTIEGQLTDGTIFTARPSAELLRSYGELGDLPPDRLPEESLRLYPNPFLTSLTIEVSVSGPAAYANSTGREHEGASSVRIYDVKGRLVRTVLNEEMLHPGGYQTGWDGLDENGAKVAPGVYYCKLQIGARSLTKRVILLR